MITIDINKCIVSSVGTNCYLVRDKLTQKACVIDPGAYNDTLVNMLKSNNVEEIEYILLTHGHFDHIDGTKQLQSNYGGKIVISTIDEKAFSDDELSLNYNGSSDIYPEKADICVNDGDQLSLGESKFTVLSTPGHTAGSVCFVFEDVIFSGDTLFFNNCGRTDLKSGNYQQILNSLKILADLEGDYEVYPGHGPKTWLSSERQYNPYMKLK